MAKLPPTTTRRQSIARLLLEAFREIAQQYVWIIVFIFGGVIGAPLLLNQFFDNWTLSLLGSLAIYFVMAIVFSVWGLIRLLLRDRDQLAALTALRYQEEKRSVGLSLYRQREVYLENHLYTDGTWESYSEIEVEITTDGGVDVIHHYNREAASVGVAFLNLHCIGRVTNIPHGYDWQFRCFPRGDPQPNAVDILFLFTPPLRKDVCVRYMYEESYKGVCPVTYEEVLEHMNRRMTHRGRIQVVKGYRILSETTTFMRKIIFPDHYAITDVCPDVVFRGVAVPEELQRTENSFHARKVRDHWEITWEIDNPVQDHVYYICWTPAQPPSQE